MTTMEHFLSTKTICHSTATGMMTATTARRSTRKRTPQAKRLCGNLIPSHRVGPLGTGKTEVSLVNQIGSWQINAIETLTGLLGREHSDQRNRLEQTLSSEKFAAIDSEISRVPDYVTWKNNTKIFRLSVVRETPEKYPFSKIPWTITSVESTEPYPKSTLLA